MKKQWSKKIVSCVFCMIIVTIMTFTTGCNGNTEQENSSVTSQKGQDDTKDDNKNNINDNSTILGEGDISFSFSVVNAEGEKTLFEIHTEKETVGEALLELALIDGDKSEYGLYVKTVNGITADYDKDGMYWAFYINDEYAETGVDSTEIVEENEYSFRIEKA